MAPGPLHERIDVVLVPHDGSEYARRGLSAGRELAARVGAEVHLFSAVAKEEDVDERVATLAHHRVEVSVVVDPDPASAIHEELGRLGGPALACMASHGRGRSAALVGSVATDLIVRNRDAAVLAGPLVERPPQGRGVVACVDDDPAAGDVVTVAVHWVDLIGGPLVVLSVAEPAPEPVAGGPIRRVVGPDGDVEAYLEALVQPFREAGAEIETTVVWDPVSVGSGIEIYVRDHPAELVVTAARARSGLAAVLVGSSAASIVRHSASPVLVFPVEETSR